MKSRGITATLFQDAFGNLAIFYMILVLLILPLINDPTQADDEPPPGLIQVVACWPDAADVDVDVWAVAPGDEPVGFKRRDGKVWTLMRDDTGLKFGDTDNCELLVARSTPAGDYQLNAHAFSARPVEWPVVVQFTAILRANGGTHTIRKGSVSLRSVGDERTMARFRMDAAGRLVSGSVGDVFSSIQR